MALRSLDLMIGDWVLYEGETKQIVAIPSDNEVIFDGTLEKYVSDCLPILLTPEILEKNGFVKGYMFNNVWNYIEDYKRLVIVYTGEVFNIQDTFIEFKHVHKLQHILKICGIEKEIIL